MLLQVLYGVSIRHVHQNLFSRSERLSGHTNWAQMMSALFRILLRQSVEQADATLAPAVRVAIWDDSEDALAADGAVEVLVRLLVRPPPADLPRTLPRLDHRQQVPGVRTPVRTGSETFEVLHVGLTLWDQACSRRLRRHVGVHPLFGLRRDEGEEGINLKSNLLSGLGFGLPRFGLLGVFQLVSLPLLELTNPPGLLLLLHRTGHLNLLRRGWLFLHLQLLLLLLL